MKVSTFSYNIILLLLFVSATALPQQVRDIGIEREELEDFGESESMRTKHATETKTVEIVRKKVQALDTKKIEGFRISQVG